MVPAKWYCIAIFAKRPWHDGPHARLQPPHPAGPWRRAASVRRRIRARHAVTAPHLHATPAWRTGTRCRWRRRRAHLAIRLPPAAAAHDGDGFLRVRCERRGYTNWAIARPPGQSKPLRPVIALHGKGNDASSVMAGGVEQGLAQAVNAGLPPFAVVSVDGGGSYWHRRSSGEDSGAMVLNELIPILDSHGPGHLAGRIPGLVDGRLRRLAARRPVGCGPDRGDLRGEPGTVDIRRGGCTRRIRRLRRLRRQLGVGDARPGTRSRSGWTAATAIRSTPRPSSSSRSCPTLRRAAFRPAVTTGDSGARSCRPS